MFIGSVILQLLFSPAHESTMAATVSLLPYVHLFMMLVKPAGCLKMPRALWTLKRVKFFDVSEKFFVALEAVAAVVAHNVGVPLPDGLLVGMLSQMSLEMHGGVDSLAT